MVRAALERIDGGPHGGTNDAGQFTPGQALTSVLTSLSEGGHELFEYELERGSSYCAVRAIAPSLFSLYLDEVHAYRPLGDAPYRGLPSPHFFL